MHLLLFVLSLFREKRPGESIDDVTVWFEFREGLGCLMVTSVKMVEKSLSVTTRSMMVEKSLSVTTRSILPAGGLKPGEGGARSKSTISFAVGSWADVIIEETHWTRAVHTT